MSQGRDQGTAGNAELVTIYANASLFTGTREQPWAEACAVRGGTVVDVGTLAHVREAWPGAVEEDLGGTTVVPGLIDAHNHFLSTGESLASLDLRYPGVDSPSSLLAAIRAAADETRAGKTISGFGFDNAKYDLPSLAELDAAAGDHRLQLFHTSGHNVLVNSVVLADAGIGDDAADPPGGRFVRDAAGRLTGLCLDAACGAVVPTDIHIGSHGPNFHTRAPIDTLVDAVDRASRAFVAAGLTCVADAQVTSRELSAYREARERGVLGVRTVCMPLSHQLETYRAVGLAGPLGDDRLSIGHLKIYADGTLTGGTAAFSDELEVLGQEASLFHDPSELVQLIHDAWSGGWRVAVHAQGDVAISHVLDGFERGSEGGSVRDPRPRIEHCGYPTSDGIERMRRLGVTAVNQPSYLFDFGDEYAASLGDHVHDLQPWRDELESGVRVVISSDSDVSSYRPLTTIANAMLRRTREGSVLGERHRLTLEEALFAHTIDAAYAIGLEHRIGSLQPRKAADLTILGGDIRTTEAERISDLPIQATIVGGEVRFDAR